MAPEIEMQREYKGTEVDLFAVGVILYVMRTGSPPFLHADDADPHYKLMQERPKRFWKKTQSWVKEDPLSEEFIDMAVSLMNRDPAKRYTIKQIFEHPYFNGPTPTK